MAGDVKQVSHVHVLAPAQPSSAHDPPSAPSPPSPPSSPPDDPPVVPSPSAYPPGQIRTPKKQTTRLRLVTTSSTAVRVSAVLLAGRYAVPAVGDFLCCCKQKALNCAEHIPSLQVSGVGALVARRPRICGAAEARPPITSDKTIPNVTMRTHEPIGTSINKRVITMTFGAGNIHKVVVPVLPWARGLILLSSLKSSI